MGKYSVLPDSQLLSCFVVLLIHKIGNWIKVQSILVLISSQLQPTYIGKAIHYS